MTLHPGDSCVNNWMLKAMAKDAGFLKHKRITNHSVHKFLVQKLRNANIPPTETMAITGHKNPKFHEDSPCGHVFQQTRTIFKLIQDIIKTNLTKFHEDWTIHVTLGVKNVLPTGSHFHEDQTINVAFTFHEDWTIHVTFGPYMYYEKCPNPGGHVFQPTRTIFELVQDIIGTILLTKVHKDRTINVASRHNGCHVFQPTRNIIEFAQVIIRTNLLTKFHGDRTINVTSRV
ncbi:hypothetical protein DPMN_019053 [Dreissena polymorpha]|uniref:Uncharacterized protein n=1 Tax=Dreissena polymorpha TaxID=45954 RepID=A0A9D4NHP9_DREPO|nr:hypothetical protein DPMN_019053 [Dreissena polymorpha]